ncbi:MAG: GC-type dockerin domain-anchored protein [Phycisphaerales bacterium]
MYVLARRLAVSAMLIVVCGARAQQVWHVDADAATDGDGLSWASAFSGLQEALALSSSGDEIWIAEGIYTPSDTDATLSFVMVDGVAIYGGFAGDETARSQRNPATHLSILSGDIGRDDTENPFMINSSNAGHVIVASGVSSSTVIDGLTIEHGAYGPAGLIAGDPLFFGSGIYCIAGSPNINNCVFRFNYTAFAAGGAIYFRDAHPVITNSTFSSNYGHLSNGGAIYLGGTSGAIIEDCAFTNSTLVFSSPDSSGGAIYHQSTSPLEVRRCLFENNIVRPFYSVGNDLGYGGAISSFSAPLLVEDSVFRGNKAPVGGAVIAWNESHIVNCLFENNTAEARNGTIQELGGFGGGFCTYSFADRTAYLENCTFVNNHGKEHGGVSGGWNSTARLRNCILWHNTGWNPEFQGFYREQIGGGFDIAYCLIEDIFGPAGDGEDTLEPNRLVGCIDSEPLFEAGSYRPSAGSPAIDAGRNTDWTSMLTTDLDGNPRFVDDPDTTDTGSGSAPVIDMGAYEYQVASVCPADITGDGVLDFFDVSAFLNAYTAMNPAADFDGNGVFDFFDVSAFLSAFSAGCP